LLAIPDDVLTIRRAWLRGCPAKILADMFGLSTSQVWRIATRRRFKNIPEERHYDLS
jgi:hypothetical protein